LGLSDRYRLNSPGESEHQWENRLPVYLEDLVAAALGEPLIPNRGDRTAALRAKSQRRDELVQIQGFEDPRLSEEIPLTKVFPKLLEKEEKDLRSRLLATDYVFLLRKLQFARDQLASHLVPKMRVEPAPSTFQLREFKGSRITPFLIDAYVPQSDSIAIANIRNAEGVLVARFPLRPSVGALAPSGFQHFNGRWRAPKPGEYQLQVEIMDALGGVTEVSQVSTLRAVAPKTDMNPLSPMYLRVAQAAMVAFLAIQTFLFPHKFTTPWTHPAHKKLVIAA
jgi:hypothetical protein